MQAWHITPAQWRELDDADRDLMIAHHDLVCSSCGNLRSVCSDPNVVGYPQRAMCYFTAIRDLTVRRVHAKHKKEPGTEGLHPTDGMGVWVSDQDLTPDDDFV